MNARRVVPVGVCGGVLRLLGAGRLRLPSCRVVGAWAGWAFLFLCCPTVVVGEDEAVVPTVRSGRAWSALGTGTNGSVRALALDGSGNLYAGGTFTEVGGEGMAHIAKWNGTAWSALGSGVDGMVSALAVDGAGNLYVGGDFVTAGGVVVNRVAKWNGTAWSALGGGVDGGVLALVCDATGDLYAGGYFSAAGRTTGNYIAKWDGEEWQSLGTGTDGVVGSLAFSPSGDLYAGGFFALAGGVVVDNLARWNGTAWLAVGSDANGIPNALAFDASGNLYEALSGPVGWASGVRMWDGENWVPVVDDDTRSDTRSLTRGTHALAFSPTGSLYAGDGLGTGLNYIGEWDGTSWSPLGAGTDAGVRALVCDASGDLYVGGDFVTADGLTVNYIAAWQAVSAPVARDDAYETFRNQSLVVPAPGVLANDSAPAGDPLSAEVIDEPVHGTLVLAVDGSFTYTPNAGYVGTDGFLYSASTDERASDNAVVTITVINRLPVAVDDAYSTLRGQPLTVPAIDGVLANDHDPDGDALVPILTATPAHGTLESFGADGSFTYVPTAGYAGADSFTYRVDDGEDVSTDTTVAITVVQTYTLTVVGGSGGGNYPSGTAIPIVAEAPPAGQIFAGWSADPAEYAPHLANPGAGSTVFTMPADSVTLSSTYRLVEDKVEVVPIVCLAVSTVDKATVLPAAAGGVRVGDTFFVELWARNADASAKWLTIGGADLAYDTTMLDAETAGLRHSATYDALPQGSVDDGAGLVDEFGGGVEVGYEDTELGTSHWARIGSIEFLATGEGDVTISLAPATTLQWFRKDTDETEAVSWDDVSLGGSLVTISEDPRTPDPSGDGACNLIDYGYFLGCYGKTSTDTGWLPHGPQCDYNRDETVNLMDYGYFLGFYGKPPEEWQLPVVPPAPGRASKLRLVAVAVPSAGLGDKAASLPAGLLSVLVGEDFVVELWARNLDGSDSWISVGGADVGYTTTAVDVTGLHHGGVYTNLPQGTIDEIGGLVDEFGGGASLGAGDPELGTSRWARLGYLDVTATVAGEVQFAPGPAATAQFFRSDPFGVVDWSEVEFVAASLMVTGTSRTVAFRPGEHGSIPAANDGADYVVSVPDGAARPPAPFVAADEGWQLAGWDWQAVVRDGPPAIITSDWAVTALYEEAVPGWTVELLLTGAEPATLTFGMQAGATDGWDDGVDVQYPPPATGQACLAADDLALTYSTDLRACAGTAQFLLIVNAAEAAATTVAWDLSGLPVGKYLSIYEVLLDGMAPSRDPVGMGLVGNTALDMALVPSLNVPSGEVRSYLIQYGDHLVFDLRLWPGWNLVSLPIQPTPPGVDDVFDDGLARGSLESSLRDGLRGTVHSGSVWTWQGAGYGEVAEMQACIGYWVHVAEAVVVLVPGVPANQLALDLVRGWNQRGVEVERASPVDARVVGTPWGWDPLGLRYVPAGRLFPGMGYWLNAREDCTVPFPAR